MVKSYWKYEQSSVFGNIVSDCNICWISGNKVAVGSLESVIVWDLKTSSKTVFSSADLTSAVTYLSLVSEDVIAAGYNDGSIRLWDSRTADVLISFTGHRSRVTSLIPDHSQTRLASGAADGSIIVWDLVSEEGLYKLNGHKGQINGMRIIGDDQNFMLSCAKDGLLKLWDLDSQHCSDTVVAQKSDCWALEISPDNMYCLAGGDSSDISVWQINTNATEGSRLQSLGAIARQAHTKDRVLGIHFHPDNAYFVTHGVAPSIELWKIRTPAETTKAVARKRRRRREKNPELTDEHLADLIPDNNIADVLVSVAIIPVSPYKVRSIAWLPGSSLDKRSKLHLAIAYKSNLIDSYSITFHEQNKSAERATSEKHLAVDLPGHRTDIRTLSLSADNSILSSASNGQLKIWNVKTGNCIRTIETGYALCSAFLPGDTLVVIGTKEGTISLYDIASSSIVSSVKAHDGAVWSMHLSPDGVNLVSGGADKMLRFWAFKPTKEIVPGTERYIDTIKIKETRNAKITDDILSVRYSPDNNYVAASLLDNTVKVFYNDTLKYYLTLYGHKLPVLAMDISYDSKLIITSSADKNIKIWGLDFGDCHRSLFAHQDSITAVAFEQNTHHFFSASKDRVIKYWDGDKFECIQKLTGHQSEIWAMTIANNGSFVVSASHDRSIRVWKQSDEEIFLEEAREQELEETYENDFFSALDQANGDPSDDTETQAVSKQTIETLKAGDRFLEALDLCYDDEMKHKAYYEALSAGQTIAKPDRNIVFTFQNDVSAEQYLLSVIEKVPIHQLGDALLILPFDRVIPLLTFINKWAKSGKHPALICRILYSVIRMFQNQLVTSSECRSVLEEVYKNLSHSLRRVKDEMGYNLAGLNVIRRYQGTMSQHEFQDDETLAAEEAKSQKKRAFTTI
ncbi:hypothetical protein CANCADRAFT_31064 [Tortispora caseinolytica NRRL Y-17796]|uniref:Small-subunit processome Utp12 domain-containing protein n=1 Tax=Tortispora caseinolytica NRRL Y-17796 TaxID=767744 RepID=A0A1E4TDW5_9ASCO|nr:hypothetical protein CANCADRAFT_31064 [Tortispora caseinolytica NRRL Y-17796]